MATVTSASQIMIGPSDAGRTMTLDEFIAAEWQEGYLYELARGVVVVSEVPSVWHAWIVGRVGDIFAVYNHANPGRIILRAAGSDCRIRLPGMISDRHPDQAIYLTPPPQGKRIWFRWVPAIVVEVVSPRGEDRDYIEKREEYLRCGVLEYWIFDPSRRKLLVLQRAGDTWQERELGEEATYRTELLPGLEVSVGQILGPVGDDVEYAEDEPADDAPPAA